MVVWVLQEFDMLKRLDHNVVKVTSPSIIEVDGGVTIFVDYGGNVTIEGHKSMKFKCEEDIEFDAKNINLQARENVYIGSGKQIVEQAPTIHLNPEHDNSGYKK
jgi:hypothetical protein